MLKRSHLLSRLCASVKAHRAVALLGPRQCGKTTLARRLIKGSRATYFNLENPVDLARLAEPMTALEALRGLVVIDEVQLRPNLFGALRVLLSLDYRPPDEVYFGELACSARCSPG